MGSKCTLWNVECGHNDDAEVFTADADQLNHCADAAEMISTMLTIFLSSPADVAELHSIGLSRRTRAGEWEAQLLDNDYDKILHEVPVDALAETDVADSADAILVQLARAYYERLRDEGALSVSFTLPKPQQKKQKIDDE